MLHPCKKVEGVKYCERDGSEHIPTETCKVFRREGAFVLVENQGKILLVKPVDGKGYWELPGGGVDQGETFQQAAVREAKEETGFDLSGASLTPVFEHRAYLYLKNEPEFWNYDQNYFEVSGHTLMAFDGIKDAPEDGHIRWVDKDDLKNIQIKGSVIKALKATKWL